MTLSLMLGDVAKPGIAVPIKALLPDLKPIIPLDRPLDEEVGRRIAAWARGDVPAAPAQGDGAPAAGNAPEGEPPPASPDGPSGTTDMPPPDDQQAEERRVETRAREIAAMFAATRTRADHLAITDDEDLRRHIEWLKRRRKDIYEEHLGPAIKASWQRTDPKNQQPELPS
jgi:pyruvate/2-oxoglutarate dehydrogenase complex dihydrolipoamide acyltransferase (E2) component